MESTLWIRYITFETANLISQCNASRNRSLLTHPLKFFSSYTTWFVSLICGSVSVCTVYAGANQARAAVISRVSSERAGARFQVTTNCRTIRINGSDLYLPPKCERRIFLLRGWMFFSKLPLCVFLLNGHFGQIWQFFGQVRSVFSILTCSSTHF